MNKETGGIPYFSNKGTEMNKETGGIPYLSNKGTEMNTETVVYLTSVTKVQKQTQKQVVLTGLIKMTTRTRTLGPAIPGTPFSPTIPFGPGGP